MSGTVTPTLADVTPYVDATGIHIPTFETCYSYFQNQYLGIYGSDVYIANDSQDGQWVGVIAKSYYDTCVFAVAVYNSFSPASAQGAGLSAIVKLNGLTRASPSYSTVELELSGTAFATITNGYATDENNNQWNLPASVEIPVGTTITVSATCNAQGAIAAAPNSITTIGNPQQGWSGVNNPAAANLGEPVEEDGPLRARQQISTALPSVSVMDGITGAIAAIPNVTRVIGYENDTDTTDANGIPANAISFIVDGGDDTAIATTIANKKTLGAPTYGTTSVIIFNAYGNPKTINFYRSTQVTIIGQITIKALAGYTTLIGTQIIAAIVAYITASIAIGQDVSVSRLYMPANLYGGAGSDTFEVDPSAILIARAGGSIAAANVPLAFNEEAVTTTANWTLIAGDT